MSFDLPAIKAQAELDLSALRRQHTEFQGILAQIGTEFGQLTTGRPQLDTSVLQRQAQAQAQAVTQATTQAAQQLRGAAAFDSKPLQDANREFATMRLRVSDLTNPVAALSSSIGQVGIGASAAAVAAVAGLAGISVAAIKTASDLQAAVASVKSIAPTIDTKQVTSELNDMQTRVAQSSAELARSLYNVFSSIDVSQEQALKLVEQFAQGAIAAETDAQTFGTAVLGVLNAYKLSTEDATHVSDVFFNTVKAGVVTGAELASGLGPVTAAAKAAGVSFDELGGLIAGVTKEGGPAAQNINNLTNLLVKLITPETLSNFAQLDVRISDTAGGIRPLLSILGDLGARLDSLAPAARAAALQQIFPDIQARQAAQTVISQLGFINDQMEINRTQAGSTAAAYKTLSETAKANATIFGNAWAALLADLGANVLPGVTALVQAMTTGLGTLRTAVQDIGTSPGLTGLRNDLTDAAAGMERLSGLFRLGITAANDFGNAAAAALAAAKPAPEANGQRGLIPIVLDKAGINTYAEQWRNEFRLALQRNIDAGINVDFSKAALQAFQPGALERAIAPDMETFQAFLRQQGGETGLNFAQGIAQSELSHAAADAVRQNEPSMRAALATLAAVGIDGGKALLASFEQGVEAQSPDLFRNLADLKEGVAGQLRDLLATAPDDAALKAGTGQALDDLAANLRAKFPEIGDLTVELIKAQVSDRSTQLFADAGKAAAKAFADQIIAGVAHVPADFAAILANLPTEAIREQVIKTSVDPTDIANLLRLKQAMGDVQQEINGLNDKQAAARAQALLNSAAFGQNAGALEQAVAITRAAAAEQAVLGGRYDQLANATLPGLTAAQAELVKQFQLAHDPATAAALAVGLVGGSAQDAARALQGTGADFTRYVQGLQRIAESADPVAAAHRLIEASAKSALSSIAAGLSAADRAWLEYRAARTSDAQALTELASHFGIDPEKVKAALAQGGQAFADLQAQMARVVATADPVASANHLIEASAKSMLQTLEQGLPAADKAWLDYTAARQGDAATLRSLYAQMGGDLAAFDHATEAQQQRSVARLSQARQAAEVFRSTGRLLPAPQETDLLGPQRQQQVEDQTRSQARQAQDLAVQQQRTQEDRARQAADFQRQGAQIDTDFAQRQTDIANTLANAQASITHARGVASADFQRGQLREIEDANLAFTRQQRDRAQQDAESLRGLREQAGDLLVGATNQFHDLAARAVDGLVGLSGTALTQAAAGVVDRFQGVSDAAQQAAQQVTDAQTTMLDKIRDTFQQINRQASDTIKGIRDQLLQAGQLGNTPSLFGGIFTNLPGQGSPEQQAALKATADRNQALLDANLKIADTATKQQSILDTAAKARADIDKQAQDAQDALQKQQLDLQRQAREQRAQMISQLTRMVEGFQRSAFQTVQQRTDQRVDEGTARDRQVEDQQRAFERQVNDFLAQDRAAQQAAADADRASRQQREEQRRQLQEQERQAALQQRRQDEDLARQEQRRREDLRIADDRFNEQVRLARAQIALGERTVALLERRPQGVQQNFNLPNMVLVEPATQFLDIGEEQLRQRINARTVG